MRVFVKFYRNGSVQTLNEWCDIEPFQNEGLYRIIRPYRFVIGRDCFLTVQEIRKQKIERICLK